MHQKEKTKSSDRNPRPEKLPSKDLLPSVFLFLSVAGLDAREVGKGPEGYGQEKPLRQRKEMSSQRAAT